MLVFTGVPIEIHYNVYSKIIQAIIKLSLKQERPFYVYDESHTETLKIILAKAFKLESDFETSIFRCDFVKILVNPSA